MSNLPDDVTDSMVSKAGGACGPPTDEQLHAYVCDNWRWLIQEKIGFEDVEVDRSYDDGATDVLLTVRMSVNWTDV